MNTKEIKAEIKAAEKRKKEIYNQHLEDTRWGVNELRYLYLKLVNLKNELKEVRQ